MITVIIGGDVCPTKGDTAYFVGGNVDGIFHDLMDEIRQADLSLVNLECPLIDEDHPIAKCGPNLRAPVAAIHALREAGIDVLNLANNHIMDHGAPGLECTLATAQGAGISTVGAGRNRSEARKMLIRPVRGIRVGIMGVAEHEFSIATETKSGANPLDPIDITRHFPTARADVDYLIVLLHGGNETYPYPSPRLVDTCRFFVEQGANAVICQHSHCIGCYEEYRGAHIVYGQGNLIFDNPRPTSGWNEGVLVRLHISGDGASRMELVPYEQSRVGVGARKLPPHDAKMLLQAMAERSANLVIPGFIEEQWLQFCRKTKHWYLSALLGHGRILTRLNRHGHLVRLLYPPSARSAMLNMIRCEAHREALITICDEDRS
jgi:poly-gamma-glutamate synthesis protein (capsule biosynthesis protein)